MAHSRSPNVRSLASTSAAASSARSCTTCVAFCAVATLPPPPAGTRQAASVVTCRGPGVSNDNGHPPQFIPHQEPGAHSPHCAMASTYCATSTVTPASPRGSSQKPSGPIPPPPPQIPHAGQHPRGNIHRCHASRPPRSTHTTAAQSQANMHVGLLPLLNNSICHCRLVPVGTKCRNCILT